MPPKRRRPPSRPPEDDLTFAPPSRRAKTVAKGNITIQLATEHNGFSVPSSSYSNGVAATDTSPDVKVKKQEPLEIDMDVSGGSSRDVCAICLAPRSDPTLLDNCVHSFCYTCTSQWMKHAGKCPLCMKKVERSGNVRVDRSSDLSKANVRLVNEIARLEMLKRDVTTRGDLVGNIVFRSLIYKDNLEWSSIDRNAIRVPFSPEVFSANVADSTERLRSFLERELQIVWRCKKPNETKEEYARGRSAIVREIIFWCSECQINSPQFSRNLRLVGIFPGYLERFQSELFEFASSMLSLRDFDKTSAYSSPELRQVLHRRNRRGHGNQEVVLLSGSDSDSGVVALENGRPRAHRNGGGDDVIVLSDNNSSDEEPVRARGESNYVRQDEATSSNSEASNAGDFYTRPACLLPRYPFRSRMAPMHVVDAFGSSRDLFQHLFTPFAFSHRDQDFLGSLNFPPVSNENDATIVLSSDDENDRSTSAASNRHSTRTSSLQSAHGNSSSSSQDTVTPNDIAWLTPMDRTNQHGSAQEAQVLPDAPSSSNSVPSQLSSVTPRKPKSLFAPRNSKRLPDGPVEVKELMVEKVSEDGKLLRNKSEVPDEPMLDDDSTVHNPPPEKEMVGAAVPSNDWQDEEKTSRSTRRKHHRSWKSLFKRFRKKLQREKSQRKREKVYKFLDEMKQLEEDRRESSKSAIEASSNRNNSTNERRSRRSHFNSWSESRRGDYERGREDTQARRRSRSTDAPMRYSSRD
ncbi:hypothetical protein GCK32_006743 [Trichostrongylus colubriformis]|uniref:RING-type domain-containing protein n=1 Tax=Trichostrongylus colubriformis TaxID=6319 RepID=A0AAN8IU47_TRICO